MTTDKMTRIDVDIPGAAYPVYCGRDILQNFGAVLSGHKNYRQAAVVTHPSLRRLCGERLLETLPVEQKFILEVPEGEGSKSHETLMQLYTGLLDARFERGALIIALGGGVIGDLAGFAAATYLRGVDLVQCPTTLLAQVDSSIGGKTGINHPLGKNLIGAFKQPLFVFSDTALLATLPAGEIRCGLGEVIKYAFIGDEELLTYLEENVERALAGDPAVLEYLVVLSARQKAAVVEKDEKESGLRMILNFGHTFGHALEAEFAYSGLKHGETVILGMKCALRYAAALGRLDEAGLRRGMALLERIPVAYDRSKIDPARLWQRMLIDKKVKDGAVRLILVDRPGHWFVEEARREEVETAFAVLR